MKRGTPRRFPDIGTETSSSFGLACSELTRTGESGQLRASQCESRHWSSTLPIQSSVSCRRDRDTLPVAKGLCRRQSLLLPRKRTLLSFVPELQKENCSLD